MTRDRLLGQARADLVALPDLADQLARTLTERHHDISGYRGKIIGSPAPLSMPVVHLTDVRHKPRWHGEDPRHADLADRYGIAPTLEAWVRVLAEELPEWPDLTEHATVRSECSVLLEHWGWITEQTWAVDLAEDITKITRTVRAQLGQRPEYRPRCRKCASTVIPVDADRRLTSWEACAYGACTGCDWTYPTGPALAALAEVQEPMPLRDIAPVVGLPLRTLQRWVTDGLIAPVHTKRRGRVFDLATVRAVANIKFKRNVQDKAV